QNEATPHRVPREAEEAFLMRRHTVRVRQSSSRPSLSRAKGEHRLWTAANHVSQFMLLLPWVGNIKYLPRRGGVLSNSANRSTGGLGNARKAKRCARGAFTPPTPANLNCRRLECSCSGLRGHPCSSIGRAQTPSTSQHLRRNFSFEQRH